MSRGVVMAVSCCAMSVHMGSILEGEGGRGRREPDEADELGQEE